MGRNAALPYFLGEMKMPVDPQNPFLWYAATRDAARPLPEKSVVGLDSAPQPE